MNGHVWRELEHLSCTNIEKKTLNKLLTFGVVKIKCFPFTLPGLGDFVCWTTAFVMLISKERTTIVNILGLIGQSTTSGCPTDVAVS